MTSPIQQHHLSQYKVALLGRPNVGKSSLFNRFIGARRAIVEDTPGITRDRQYGSCAWRGDSFTVIDTGGLLLEAKSSDLSVQIKAQVEQAMQEAQCLLFVVDGRTGVTPLEEDIARFLRKKVDPEKTQLMLLVNKIDSPRLDSVQYDFARLGIEPIFTVSAETGLGIHEVLDAVWESGARESQSPETDLYARIAILGQPNAGKSTLLNTLAGEERAVVHDKAGTTVDPLDTFIENEDKLIQIVDTAGIRRKSKTEAKVEKISVIKALQAMERSDMVLLLIDSTLGLGHQDTRILSYAEKKAKALIIVLNKIDAIDSSALRELETSIREKIVRQAYIPIVRISARTGRGLKKLFTMIHSVHDAYHQRISTAELNKVMQEAVRAHPHPSDKGKAVNISFFTQTAVAPPRFVLFGNRPQSLQQNYLRYLENVLRAHFDFSGSPLRWSIRKKN